MTEIDYNNIRLIIWDLDDCLWDGTLSEEPISLPAENKNLIIALSERGIINSICTKNDTRPVNEKLEEYGLKDYFVFNSINWEPKGERIKSILARINMRAENVLFIDDNLANLKEAEFSCPGIMTCLPECIGCLILRVTSMGKDDSALSRLGQYRELEKKSTEELKYSSNEEFLYASCIQVDINRDVNENVERLYELVLRTNQLNFTKRRDSDEAFKRLISDTTIEKGYVQAKDKFCNYGIVGFYAIKDNALIHFCFSCRTMGMGIEQYVYSALSYPEIEIKGPVLSTLQKDVCPKWINAHSEQNECVLSNYPEYPRAIMKGPCDLSGVADYLRSDAIYTEFYYTTDLGQQVEIQCATQNIVNCRLLSESEKAYLSKVMPFYENSVFQTQLYKPSYKIVILSLVSDFNFGVYQHKTKNIKVALGQDYKDITDPLNWDGYISGETYNSHYRLTKEQLEGFAQEFYKVPYSINDIIQNINYILDHISDKALLILLLGSDIHFPKLEEANYENRAEKHKTANTYLKAYYMNNSRIHLVEPSKYITGENDYYDTNINHYSKRVLYCLAAEICSILNDYGIGTRTSSRITAYLSNVLNKIKKGMRYYSVRAVRYRLSRRVKT